jgi:uncharacterized 2Fe-2S/4Fe-4S cluster protein (DUF4445 family)
VDSRGSDWHSPAGSAEGYALACRAWVTDQALEIMVLEESEAADASRTQAILSAGLVHPDLLPKPGQLKPLLDKVLLKVESPAKGEPSPDLDRLSQAIEKQFGEVGISCPLSVLRLVASTLRQESGKVTATLLNQGGTCRIVHLEPGDRTGRHFGLAVDVGTTTVVVQLVDLKAFKVASTAADYNSQVDCGLDVISRINYAHRPDRLEELRQKILSTLNRLVGLAATAAQVERHEISEAVISGNPTMTHLLLGLEPEYIRLDPYVPTVLQVPGLTAGDMGLEILPQGRVSLSPAVGSYVGGDITAGLLCTDLAAGAETTSLFIDIGTNGEVAAGNRDCLMACACSAGPAFEGGGMDCGMRAAPGAIEKVEVDAVSGKPQFWTIGGGKPKGICGSGIISAVASLFLSGWLDAAGKLDHSRPCSHIYHEGRRASFLLAGAAESATGKPLMLSEADIDNVIRAKAAIYSAFSLLLKHLDSDFKRVANIYVAGGFGRYLDLEKAVTIGLLPDVDRAKFHFIGNASLEGSRMALTSREFRQKQQDLAGRMTYLDLGGDAAYMEQYTGALFLPHTDAGRFPSVKRNPA